MELLTWSFLAAAIPAVIFAGISKGGFGSGAAFAGSSLLALVVEPGVALGIMLPLLMLIDVASLRAYWDKWHWPDARLLMLSAGPGVLLGAVFYVIVDANALRVLIGAICLLFVAWQLANASGVLRFSDKRFGPRTAVASGLGIGFTSFVSHAGGPLAAVYLLGRGLPKTTYQSTTVVVFFAVNIMKFACYAFMGIFTWQTWAVDLVLAPFAILGTWIGIRAHVLVSERFFFGITYVLLTITGSKLIWDALS